METKLEIKQLKPKQPKGPVTPQCSAIIGMSGYENPHWVARRRQFIEHHGYNPNQCARASTVTIDGIPYCRQHAGSIAIDTLVSDSRAEHLSEETLT